MHYSNDCRRGLLTKAALGTSCYQDGPDGGAAGAARAVDDKGRHAPGRISIVFMANIWTHDYWPPAWIRDNHRLLCQQQAASGVVPRRKRTAGAEAKVAAPVSTAPLARRG